LLDAVAQAASFIADGDGPGFMNKVTLLTHPQREPKPKPPDKAKD
jgi:hypothetical protein